VRQVGHLPELYRDARSTEHKILTVVSLVVMTVLCDNEATKCGADRPILLSESCAMRLAALLMLKNNEAQNSPMVRVSSVVMLVRRKGVNAFGNISKMMD
jgi:hypothetical protein